MASPAIASFTVRRTALSQAFEQIEYMSAPVMSWRRVSAIFLSVRSLANRNRPVTACSTLSFSSTVLLGPTYSSLSNRPGRNSAGSIKSGRLVAASMKICCAGSFEMPSISLNICETTRSITPPESPLTPRFGANESSSSRNRTHGEAVRARSNTSRTFCSLCPTYMFSSSGPCTDRKLRLHSVATAFAISVLPVPGGPYRRMPERRIFRPSKCLWRSGSPIEFCISDFSLARPPISDHSTRGTRGAPRLSEKEDCIFSRQVSKCATCKRSSADCRHVSSAFP
uniref:Uncharacterized protein n=1 Tax=Anopheles darlingi TaxID=43151 RepID=A0A2M4CVD5_ANODA